MTSVDVVGWQLTAHACRTCMGRVLVCGSLYRCSGCGMQSTASPTAICGCGIGSRADGARFQCVENHDRAAIPAEIVIGWGAPTPATPTESHR